jgi:hypothetical protein
MGTDIKRQNVVNIARGKATLDMNIWPLSLLLPAQYIEEVMTSSKYSLLNVL